MEMHVGVNLQHQILIRFIHASVRMFVFQRFLFVGNVFQKLDNRKLTLTAYIPLINGQQINLGINLKIMKQVFA